MSRIAVLGLGYAGLPVTVLMIQAGRDVVAYDSDTTRVTELRSGVDRTGQISPDVLQSIGKCLTDRASDIEEADIYVIIVQTGIDADQNPDVRAVESAAQLIAPHIAPGNLVVLSSTVPIGFTEGHFRSKLEEPRGLIAGTDFGLAFAPERIDPGNHVNTVRSITKIISAIDEESLARTRDLYEGVVDTIVEAPTIRVAEASRLIENAQRDVNIAFLNDAAAILKAWDIDTNDVLAIARTKWNFLPFRPGLVGGHCVNVHTHYLRQAASHVGLTPSFTTLVRQTNDDVAERIAHSCAQALMRMETPLPAVVTILGAAYKENVPDTRGSAVVDIVRELEKYGCQVQLTDPLARAQDVAALHALDLIPEHCLVPAHAVILAVAHQDYVDRGWELPLGLLRSDASVVLDVCGTLPRETKPARVTLWRL